MAKHILYTTDEEEAALDICRRRFNEARPEDEPPVEPTEDNPDPVQPVPAPGPFKTTTEYWQYVQSHGPLASYVKQHLGDKVVTDNPTLLALGGAPVEVGGEMKRFVAAEETEE